MTAVTGHNIYLQSYLTRGRSEWQTVADKVLVPWAKEACTCLSAINQWCRFFYHQSIPPPHHPQDDGINEEHLLRCDATGTSECHCGVWIPFWLGQIRLPCDGGGWVCVAFANLFWPWPCANSSACSPSLTTMSNLKTRNFPSLFPCRFRPTCWIGWLWPPVALKCIGNGPW